MKLLTYFSLLLLAGCGSQLSHIGKDVSSICIDSINNKTYQDAAIISGASESEGQLILLMGKRKLDSCSTALIQNNCYQAIMSQIGSTGNLLEVNYRLGRYDVYENEKLVFPSDVPVYTVKEGKDGCYAFFAQ